MAMDRKLCSTVALLSVFLLLAGLAVATKDPQLKQCKQDCRVQQQYDEKQKEHCEKRCAKYYREKQRGEKQREGETGEEEEEWGGRLDDVWPMNPEPAEKHLKQCQRQCERRQEGGQQKALCRLKCRDKYRREKEGGGQYDRVSETEEMVEGREGGGEEEENPYVFDKQHFTSRVTTEHGRVVVLPKFTQRSKLLRGLEKYRLGILVANPQTFVTPTHLDADAIFFVSWGRGTISMIRENNRESHNVERGDIIMISSGTTYYVTNRDDRDKLYIVKFIKPVNLPGHYEAFFGAGGENPESFFRAFSREILQSAFKTSLGEIFTKQDQGPIVRATKEQIRAMSRHGEEGTTIWPFAGESSRGTYNIFRKGPKHSNNFGELFETDFSDFRPLQDLDVRVSYANITNGAMSAPYYNSRSTKVAVVVAGEGYIEIACPHIAGSKQHQQGGRKGRSGATTYRKVSSRLGTDSVFIVPAGHPFVTVASKNNNLEIACFEIKAEGNVRFPLAGKKNVFNAMEREAKELAFNSKADDVERVFGSQEEEWFFKGPAGWQHQQEGRAYE